MTDKQINVAIAEACGWIDIIAPTAPPEFNRRSCGRLGNFEPKQIPDYCNDLNAMHEAEKALSDDQMWIMARNIELNESRWYFHASARERAEAFLRTLGKWEEVQG